MLLYYSIKGLAVLIVGYDEAPCHSPFFFLTYLNPSCFQTSITYINDQQNIYVIQQNVFQLPLKILLGKL
jgi:hypothetical protein